MEATLGAYLFQEGRLHPQVFGDHIEAEEVSVDAGARHGHPIEVLVLFRSQAEEAPAVFLGLAKKQKQKQKQ